MKPLDSKTYNIMDLEHTKTPDFRYVYSNNSGLGANFYDVNLVFGEIHNSYSNDAPTIEDKVAITMTWEHLRALGTAIQKAVAEYEKTAGPIRSKPEIDDQSLSKRTKEIAKS